jgi:hypothetical protein
MGGLVHVARERSKLWLGIGNANVVVCVLVSCAAYRLPLCQELVEGTVHVCHFVMLQAHRGLHVQRGLHTTA